MNNPFPLHVKTIGIAAPASGIIMTAKVRRRPQPSIYAASCNSRKLLDSFGIRIIEGKHLFETPAPDTPAYLSASDDARAKDLNSMIRNPDIDLILCLRGGYGSMRLLEKLDWDTLRQRDLPVVGFSDITALHLAMRSRAAGIPVAGQMAARLAEALADETTRLSFRRALSTAFHGKFAAGNPVPLTVLKDGSAHGPLIPVNLTLLTSLCGTPWLPDLSGALLVLEDIGEPVRKLDRHLTQLALAGIPQRIAGLVFAQFTDCGDAAERLNLFRNFAGTVRGPVLSGLPFGHDLPSFSFVYGERAEIRGGNFYV